MDKQSGELEDFREVNQDYKIWQIRAGIWSSLVSPLTFLVVNTTLVCVIWQGQVNISAGLLTQGMLVALVNYLLQILTELIKLAMLVTSLNVSYISAKRVQEIFDLKEEDLLEALPSRNCNRARSDQRPEKFRSLIQRLQAQL